MAMGLSFLGRGRVRTAVKLRGLHVTGAILGGAGTGVVLGGIGTLLMLPDFRPWLVGAIAAVAFALAVGSRPVQLGRQVQVPRAWNQTMPPGRRYFFWGALLGSGVATPILTSAFLVLLAAQVTGGLAIGALSGAVFGGTRQAMALLPGLWRLDPSDTLALLARFRSLVRSLNAVVTLGAGLMLVVFAWH